MTEFLHTYMHRIYVQNYTFHCGCAYVRTYIYNSQVQVVKEKNTGETFAMKVMRKADILRNPDVRQCIICTLVHMSVRYLCKLYSYNPV